MKTQFCTALLFSAALFAAGGAAAGDQVQRREISVASVNWTDAAQVRRLHARLRVASRQVCTVPGDQVQHRRETAACRRDALQSAMRQVAQRRAAAQDQRAPMTLVAK